ncbi:hypothetical protein LA366_04365 [Aeromonas jandaei]|uniref:Uncharacterized protein n=1 Tax=Aeromonas jandaei TaxID=650 RepID=A0A7T4A978_AERJA|nr:hypothetical protein [Aeromonas jandaei]QQB19650.1 hypothetical protein I6H43_19445 [Aeromonas jandaei]UCA34327.1 hypothetical protein LA366_04365 [Aeromonas jandaei]
MPKEDEDIARSGVSHCQLYREQRRAAQAARGGGGGDKKAEADPTWRKRAARFAQIKKSRRYRNDKAGSSNKEWLYKQMLYSKD